MAREITRRGVLVCLLAVLCSGPTLAFPSGGDSASERVYQQAVDRLTHLTNVSITRLRERTDDMLPAVQRLLSEGKTGEARRLAEHDIRVLILMCDTDTREIREELHGAMIRLRRMGDNDHATALEALVYDQLLPAVQSERDAGIRRIKALFRGI